MPLQDIRKLYRKNKTIEKIIYKLYKLRPHKAVGKDTTARVG